VLQISSYQAILFLSGGEENVTEVSSMFFEPGFNYMSPIEMDFPRCDRCTFFIRKRANDVGTTFDSISYSDMSVDISDPTNTQPIPFTISNYSSEYLLLSITNSLDQNNTSTRVRVIDINIKDTTDNDFIIARAIVNDDEDTTRYFNYITVISNDMSSRYSSSIKGRKAYITLKSSSDLHVLFSLYAALKETTSNKASFSYPLNTIYYHREETYNDEEFTFSISSYSHSFVQNVVSVMNVPSYRRAGVILVDRKMYTDALSNGVNPYVDIAVNGDLSGISDTFRVNFIV
jgi:hypothetical protein